MTDWEKFKEKALPEKVDFYSHLNMEDTTDADYEHANRVSKDFEKKFRRISWFVCLKQYIFVSSNIWELWI